jgi:hypothetical protein
MVGRRKLLLLFVSTELLEDARLAASLKMSGMATAEYPMPIPTTITPIKKIIHTHDKVCLSAAVVQYTSEDFAHPENKCCN